MLQVKQLHRYFDELQSKYGEPSLSSIYGAGETNSPDAMFIFMNPTGRNISANPSWTGLRAPWIGTKQVWDLFKAVDILSNEIYEDILKRKPNEWDIQLTNMVYQDIQNHSAYITNLAKCTQIDARPLSNTIFKEYLELMYEEIRIVNPKRIISFGNQVSSILLGKNISVSNYPKDEKEILVLGNKYSVYPTYYPVGQGRRNMPLAIERIKSICLN